VYNEVGISATLIYVNTVDNLADPISHGFLPLLSHLKLVSGKSDRVFCSKHGLLLLGQLTLSGSGKQLPNQANNGSNLHAHVSSLWDLHKFSTLQAMC
jgi:hypothetical protein